MPASLEPIKKIKCTYEDCDLSFDTEKQMRSHKKYSSKHDYCAVCNMDFESCDDLAMHKVFRPDNHNLACRICGDEFKSKSGLNRHIELSHKIDQKLPCLGCGEVFYRASLMVEHLEFGHCQVVTPEQFLGHIVHKHLVTELLKGGSAYDRFMQKISKFDAAQDYEEEGGIDVNDVLDDNEDEAKRVRYDAIQPEATPVEVTHLGSYPPLPSQSGASSITASMGRMSLGRASETVVGSENGSAAESSTKGTSTSSGRQLKPWAGRTSAKLFPGAKPTPPPCEFSIEHHDHQMEQEHGINIMNTRFWDPRSPGDFNPERFYDSVIQLYFCPFICEQTFKSIEEMDNHIMSSHRISRMKCPSCLKYYKSVTALMAHCESRGAKCQVNKADDFNIFLNKLTGGFLSVEEKVRPDHLHNPTVMVQDVDTGRMAPYTPPAARYLQYSASRPVDWKEPGKVAAQIGGKEGAEVFEYKGRLAKC
ncbi:hypothetical protein K458DRAFT_429632 [Lentithecium fluviatile CBS 122367]|uniref:C2H2-type domain-containing protein n=1 Tax=Lentithecium fluviatile CBS 122367 TaxID=1168545 RepID=A0A6G1J813_9PLEO|nr:hypothetical protein K458DRAFT_429632 [Lentithecium fluviatile CBS 122367]